MNKVWELFDTRIRSANIARRNLPFIKVSDDEKAKVIRTLFQHEAVNEDRVIYVHIPFCNSICPFCIYHKKKEVDDRVISDYFDHVRKQIQSLATTAWIQSKPFKAIYFGGGTPTSVPVENLESILQDLKDGYLLTDDCEITVESTITDMNPTMVSRLKKAGVNRISLGVQSFNSSVRRKLGRKASQEQISDTIAFIHQGGITNICIDLMYHLDDQDFEIWKNDLAFLGTTPITGCSVYSFIDPTYRTNPTDLKEAISIKKEYDFFMEADNRLVENSCWERFTSVQYGHREHGKAIYVVNQGKNADLVAFGSGAGGRINNYNYLQTNVIEEFISGAGDFFNDPIAFMSIDELYLKLRSIYSISESLCLQLADYRNLNVYFDDIIQKLLQDGLICSNEVGLCLTQTGRFWAANISAIFTQRIRELLLGIDKQT